jgi:hypothetical protein
LASGADPAPPAGAPDPAAPGKTVPAEAGGGPFLEPSGTPGLPPDRVPGPDERRGELFITDASGTPLHQVLRRLYLTAAIRLRPEYQSNLTDFDDSADDEFGFVSARFRFGGGVDLPADTGLFFEAQSNSFWGDDAALGPNNDASNDEDGLDVYQAFGEVRNVADLPLDIRAGRQEIVYGTEMLLGNASFGSGLSHDAVRVAYDTDLWSIHGWWSKEVDAVSVTPPAPPNPADDDADLWGIYGMLKPQGGTGLDVYWLHLRDATDAVEDRRHTLGTRIYTAIARVLTLNGEFAWQFGNTGPGDDSIRAFAGEASAELKLSDMAFTPRFTAGYAFATGDSNPGDSRAETFNPLYGNNHPRLGLSDVFSLTNLHAVNVAGALSPHEKVETGAAYHSFWAFQPDDPNAPLVLPAAPTGDSRFIGHEMNLFVNFRYSEFLTGQLAWAHIFPAQYLENQFSSGDGADRVYLHVVLAF